MSWKHKWNLYALTKNSKDSKAKEYYIKYCTILRKFIQEVKNNTAVDLQQNPITK